MTLFEHLTADQVDELVLRAVAEDGCPEDASELTTWFEQPESQYVVFAGSLARLGG